MNLYTSYTLLNISYMLTFMLCTASMLLDIPMLGFVGVLVFLAGMIQAWIFYRCPSCGKRIPLYAGRPDCCPHCGARL